MHSKLNIITDHCLLIFSCAMHVFIKCMLQCILGLLYITDKLQKTRQFSSYASKHTDLLIAVLCSPSGGEAIISCNRCRQNVASNNKTSKKNNQSPRYYTISASCEYNKPIYLSHSVFRNKKFNNEVSINHLFRITYRQEE